MVRSPPSLALGLCATLSIATIHCAQGDGVELDLSTDRDPELPALEPQKADWNCGTRCFRDERIPAGALDGFESTVDLTEAGPDLVYPLAGSVHPINLANLTFQWRRGSLSHTRFELRLSRMSGSARSYRFYVPCLSPELDRAPDDRCIYSMSEVYWTAVATENRGKTLTIRLSAMTDSATDVHRSPDTEIAFTDRPVSGGFYYWSTALGGTYRLPFGATTAVPWIAPGTSANPSPCGGCHAVSRNGNVIAFTAEEPAGYLQVSDAANPADKTLSSRERNSSMLSLNADGSRAVVAYDGRLRLLDTETGVLLAEADRTFFGEGRAAFFPEIAPDGEEVIVTLSDAPDSFWSVTTGELAIVPLLGDRFGEPKRVAAAADQVYFYPSWSPDAQWIVFASAPIHHVSYDQPEARLRLVHRDGGTVYSLDRATQGTGNTSTLPKFAPFSEADGNVFFFTFNSKRDYGFLLANSERSEPGERLPQLWFSTLDLRKLDEGDPSSPPVWLPFQKLDQRNHLGFWTDRVSCGEDGKAVDLCGPGELCIDGACRVLVR